MHELDIHSASHESTSVTGVHREQTNCGFCRLKTVRYFAHKMSNWTADLKPSEQHHFRDQYEAELCARQVIVPFWIGVNVFSAKACFMAGHQIWLS